MHSTGQHLEALLRTFEDENRDPGRAHVRAFARGGRVPLSSADEDHVAYVVHAATRVREWSQRGRAAFLSDELVQWATLRGLETLTESAVRRSAELKGRHPEIPWKDIAGFRNPMTDTYLDSSTSPISGVTSRGTCLISFPLLKPSSADGAEGYGNDRMKIACAKRRGRNHVAWSE